MHGASEEGLSPEQGADSSWPRGQAAKGPPPSRVCTPQRVHVPQQQEQHQCGEEGESDVGTCSAPGPCTAPSPEPLRLQAAPITGPSLQGADAQAELPGKGGIYPPPLPVTPLRTVLSLLYSPVHTYLFPLS